MTLNILAPVALIAQDIVGESCSTRSPVSSALGTLIVDTAGGGGGIVTFWCWTREFIIWIMIVESVETVPVISSNLHQHFQCFTLTHLQMLHWLLHFLHWSWWFLVMCRPLILIWLLCSIWFNKLIEDESALLGMINN